MHFKIADILLFFCEQVDLQKVIDLSDLVADIVFPSGEGTNREGEGTT